MWWSDRHMAANTPRQQRCSNYYSECCPNTQACKHKKPCLLALTHCPPLPGVIAPARWYSALPAVRRRDLLAAFEQSMPAASISPLPCRTLADEHLNIINISSTSSIATAAQAHAYAPGTPAGAHRHTRENSCSAHSKCQKNQTRPLGSFCVDLIVARPTGMSHTGEHAGKHGEYLHTQQARALASPCLKPLPLTHEAPFSTDS